MYLHKIVSKKVWTSCDVHFKTAVSILPPGWQQQKAWVVERK